MSNKTSIIPEDPHDALWQILRSKEGLNPDVVVGLRRALTEQTDALRIHRKEARHAEERMETTIAALLHVAEHL